MIEPWSSSQLYLKPGTPLHAKSYKLYVAKSNNNIFV